MGVSGVPQWLLPSFVRSVKAVGSEATKEDIQLYGKNLVGRWVEPHRHFHNIDHLVDLLTRIDELSSGTHKPDFIRLAAWYHAAVFDPELQSDYLYGDGEDEVNSSHVASQQLHELGVTEANILRIQELIHMLKTTEAPPGDLDARALIDSAFGALSCPPQEYKNNLKLIRQEYSELTEVNYLNMRRNIVKSLLQRRPLFLSPLALQWELQALQNLEAELTNLTRELTRLSPESLLETTRTVPNTAADLDPMTSTQTIQAITKKRIADSSAELLAESSNIPKAADISSSLETAEDCLNAVDTGRPRIKK